MTTAATEAIRIAQKYLPRASLKRQMELAKEIADATSLCEAEFVEELGRDLENLLSRT
jgi:ATP-dependent protease Clp ATPase subunit